MTRIRKSLSILLVFSILLSMAVFASVSSDAANSDDYRSWTHHDSRWSSTAMGSSTLGNGGAPTTAITKLAIQAGLRDPHDFDIGDMATLLTANSGYSGSSIIWNAPTQASLNLFTSKDVFYSNSTGTSSTGKYSDIRTKIGQGWHLVIKVLTSNGGANYVAVDEKLTLADASKVYIMDCQSNTSNNVGVVLGKRYSTITQIIGYQGGASQSSIINSDYRKWELNNTNWAETVLNGTSTMNSSYVGGGDLVLASVKLAIQAGTWSDETTGAGNSVNRAVAAINDFTTGGAINDLDSVKTGLGFDTVNTTLIGSDSTTLSTSLDTNSNDINDIIEQINEGYYLAIKINSSVGWVAVDTNKTLATGEVYIMRSTADASKNADIKLTDYYDTMNRVIGFKAAGVQVSFSGNATFTASYTKGGNTVSFSSGAFVPDAAEVTVTATPKAGYNAADDWTISGGYTLTTQNATTCTFTTNTSTSTTAAITYTPTAKTYDIKYSYGTNSTSFTYTTVPSAATTGATVNMTIAPKTDGSFVYELKIDARDSENNEIPVTHSGTTYSFTMPASDVTITFTGQNVDDWRKWARDDERWRDKEMAPQNGETVYTVFTDGAVMISLAKMVIQAGLQTPTTMTTDAFDVNEVVDLLKGASKINSTGGLTFDNTTATTLGFASFHQFIKTADLTEDILATASKRKDLVDQLKQGYHQIIRLYDTSNNNDNSEWFIIDEEKTLAAAGDKDSVALSDIYIYRATADSNQNSNYNLQQLYDTKGYRYIRRNYAFLGGTTPSRKVNITLKKDGSVFDDAHKGSVAASYTIEGETTSFSSGAYVPSRANISIKYNADPGYFAFENWTTSDTAVTSLSATETANPKEFTVNSSEFRAANNSTTASINCNVTPEVYNIYYTDGENFSYGNTQSEAGYNTSVSFTINPDNGYTVDAADVSFTDAGDATIAGLAATKSNRTYTFTMPAKDVYISATASAQTYDDYRMWGTGDSRWSDKIFSGSNANNKMNSSDKLVRGSDVILAYTKLLIQAGKTPNNITAYDSTNTSTNETHVKGIIDKLNVSTYPYSGGLVLDPSSNSDTSGWGLIAYRLGIVGGYSTSNTNYCSVGATAGGSRSAAYMYPKLLNSSTHKGGDSSFSLTKTVNGNENAYTKLLLDYLDGTHTRATTSTFADATYDYIVNSNNYKFHLMIFVNSTYGWVAVDEAQSLNTNEIWVWASHNIVSGNNTGSGNIVKLSTISTTFERVAGFKFETGSVYYGSNKDSFTAYLGDSTTDNATLKATYTYLGQTYPSEGTYDSGLYVPHGATVTVTRTALTDHYQPATDKTYGAWVSSDGTIAAADYLSHSKTAFIYNTSAQSAAAARKQYNVRYYITSVPQVHVKFLGDENGTVNGAGDALSDTATDIYEGDTLALTITPAANFEVDTLKIIKTNSSYNLADPPEEGLDPDETSITFDSDRTGGAESYFIVQATFKGHGLRITYLFKEYSPALSGSYEYKEGDGYLTNASYSKNLGPDAYDPSAENAISDAVIANAPVFHNVYFDYTLDMSSLTTNTSGSIHTASVSLTPVVKYYTVSVNGEIIDGSFHYQEEISLDASDYGVDDDSIVWTRLAESGKVGSANVCYDSIYEFRVTSDLNFTVGENLSSRDYVDGTSTITPGYTELKSVNNVEKCVQNFYIQDFFDAEAPRVYDSNDEVIDDAEDVTFLGAGVLFYAYDTDADTTVKAALGGVEPTRESVLALLENNSNAFLTQATAQGASFKGSYINYSYIKASTDNGAKLRYSSTTESFNYFFSTSITNDRTPENQKFVYRVYSFYVCSYTLDGETYVTPVLSDSYAQAKLYSIESSNPTVTNSLGENRAIDANRFNDSNTSRDVIAEAFGS